MDFPTAETITQIMAMATSAYDLAGHFEGLAQKNMGAQND